MIENYNIPVYDFTKKPAPQQQEAEVTTFVDGKTLLNMRIDHIPELYERLIPQVGSWAAVGASDTAKSMILRQMAMCVVSNQPFLGRKCNAVYNRAVVVCSEDDENAISFLLRRQNKTLGLTEEQAGNISFLFDTFDFIEKVEAELKRAPADLVIIDAFGDLFDGKDLNQNNQVRQFLNKFTLLANKYKCSIGFLHHTGKRTEDLSPSKNNAIGSQGFEAKMRLVIEVRLDAKETDLRHLCIVKGNYLPQDEKTSSHVVKMDDNFTFTDTGDRVPFDELTAGRGGQPAKNAKIEPAKVDDQLHKVFIERTFKNGKQHSKNELKRKVLDYFNVADKVGRRFVDYYDEQSWIVNVSKNASRTVYKSNIDYSEYKDEFSE